MIRFISQWRDGDSIEKCKMIENENTLGKSLGQRLRAGLFHLGISTALAICLALLVVRVWYPSPFFELAKGREIFLLLLACDVTLGPLMTLVVFDICKPKRELVRDIIIIGIVQFAAMTYGLLTLLAARPAYIVYNKGQFNVPLASELHDVESASERGERLWAPIFGPELVGVRFPTDGAQQQKLLFDSIDGGGDIYQKPSYFAPYDDVKADVLKHSRSAEEIAIELHLKKEEVKSAMATFAKNGSNVRVLPLIVRYSTALAFVNSDTGQFLGVASPVRP